MRTLWRCHLRELIRALNLGKSVSKEQLQIPNLRSSTSRRQGVHSSSRACLVSRARTRYACFPSNSRRRSCRQSTFRCRLLSFQTRPPTSVHTQPAHGISCSVGSTARGNDVPPQSLDIQCVRQHARVPSPDRAAVPLALVHIDTFALASQAVLDGELKKACLTDCLPGLIAIEEVS